MHAHHVLAFLYQARYHGCRCFSATRTAPGISCFGPVRACSTAALLPLRAAAAWGPEVSMPGSSLPLAALVYSQPYSSTDACLPGAGDGFDRQLPLAPQMHSSTVPRSSCTASAAADCVCAHAAPPKPGRYSRGPGSQRLDGPKPRWTCWLMLTCTAASGSPPIPGQRLRQLSWAAWHLAPPGRPMWAPAYSWRCPSSCGPLPRMPARY